MSEYSAIFIFFSSRVFGFLFLLLLLWWVSSSVSSSAWSLAGIGAFWEFLVGVLG